MHEQSETIQLPNGKWINVYGRNTQKAGRPLPKQHDFEKDAYETLKEAVDAAKERSKRTPPHGPTSHLPQGVSQSPRGNLGMSRAKEARQVVPIKGGGPVYKSPFK